MSMIYENAIVCGKAEVYGYASVRGCAKIYGNADIYKSEHYLVIGPLGSRNDFTTFFREKDVGICVKCGCFLGTIDEFVSKVKETHGNSKYANAYHSAIVLAFSQIEDVKEDLNL